MKYIIYVLVLILFIRCKDENKTTLKTNEVEKQIEKQEINSNKQKTSEIFDSQFVFKNDSIVQRLFCGLPKAGKINFKLISENRFTLKSKSIEGTARLLDISNGDGESDVDGQGYGYFVDEYEYTIASCSMILRIDSDENKRARIKIINCKEGYELFKDYSNEIMYQ